MVLGKQFPKKPSDFSGNTQFAQLNYQEQAN
jgi:hypothetical protein